MRHSTLQDDVANPPVSPEGHLFGVGAINPWNNPVVIKRKIFAARLKCGVEWNSYGGIACRIALNQHALSRESPKAEDKKDHWQNAEGMSSPESHMPFCLGMVYDSRTFQGPRTGKCLRRRRDESTSYQTSILPKIPLKVPKFQILNL